MTTSFERNERLSCDNLALHAFRLKFNYGGARQNSATSATGMFEAVEFGGVGPMPVPIEIWNWRMDDLAPSPIEPSWIIEGNPEARLRLLSASACNTAKTVIWSCTEGKFNWYYDRDETSVILEGWIMLESEGMPPKRYGVGDVIIFRRGAHAKWHVQGYVRKIAFLRHSPIGIAMHVVNKVKSLITRNVPKIVAASSVAISK